MAVWYRNPEPYVRECLEHNVTNFSFDAWYLRKHAIEIERFINLFLTPPLEYRVLIVDVKGTAELRRGFTRARPAAVYPTWDYKIDDIATLEELLVSPAGADNAACSDERCPVAERPVYEQEHRIVITGCPGMNTGIGRRFAGTLRDLQEEYPSAILHVTGLVSFRIMFGFGFGAVDFNPHDIARGNRVVLPNGKVIQADQTAPWQKWFALLGNVASDMKVPRNRTLYCMKAAEWASEHFREDLVFAVRRGKSMVDPDVVSHKIPTAGVVLSPTATATVGDKVLCDQCSLARHCKFFRDGEVCTLPGSETVSLAKLFQSRDPDKIIDGLGSLMEVQTERLEDALGQEREFGGKDGAPLDGEVTKLVNTLFDRGVKLAKLIDPHRFTGPQVAINLSGGQSAFPSTPQQLVAGIMRELKDQGFTDDQITPELVESFIAQRSGADQRPALEAPIDVEVVDDAEDPGNAAF